MSAPRTCGGRLARLARRWAADRRGIAAIEFALIAPLLIVLLLACTTLFVAYRDSQLAEKATFNITDLISRHTDPATDSYLATTQEFFARMTGRARSQTTYRVSSLVKKGGAFTVAWSYAVPPLAALNAGAVPAARLPVIAEGDSLVFVETGVVYTPLFTGMGLLAGTHQNIAASRPRFVSAIARSN